MKGLKFEKTKKNILDVNAEKRERNCLSELLEEKIYKKHARFGICCVGTET